MKLNVKSLFGTTHEGAPSPPLSAEQRLRRSVAACLLWEDQFYESGVSIAERIADLVPAVEAEKVAALWRRLVEGALPPPDTWEVALSAGQDKKAAWERLLKENRLGGMALLRNLRTMLQAGVEEALVFGALERMSAERILPFRFIAAARYAPQWEEQIEKAMLKALSAAERLSGRTVVLVDVSGSMDAPLSRLSMMRRVDAACGLAILAREVCERVRVFAFSERIVEIPARRGFALRDAIVNSTAHGGTYLGSAVAYINDRCAFDRLIVVTDEQSHDKVGDPKGRGYMINTASYRNGVGYGKWTHIDGWSEAALAYILESEKAYC